MSILPIITRAVLLNPRNASSGERIRKKIKARTTRMDTMSTENTSRENNTMAASIMISVIMILVSGITRALYLTILSVFK